MTTTVKTTGSGSQVVGRVVIIYDNAKAISPDGMERLLSVGSPVFANDRIITESNGRVSIVIDDTAQTQIDLEGRSEILIDEDIFGGATAEDISLMRRVVGSDMEIKASGGIRTEEDARKMVAAGADRIGASASVAIVSARNSSQGNIRR